MINQKSKRSAIIVVVDRLGSGFVGPYGNTWVETPALNRLASESLLLENMVVDSSDLPRVYRSYWSGRHAMDDSVVAPEASLAALLNCQGLRTALLSDDRPLLEHPLAAPFQNHIFVDHAAATAPADSIAETALAQVFSAGLDLLANSEPGSLIWLHARGMQAPWDAPLALRGQFRDEEDPQPYPLVEPPRCALPDDHDPDELLSIMHAYAAQVAIVDACLGTLLDAVQQHPGADDMLLVFTSPRGYPLGEHGWIGGDERQLFGETLRVPLLIRRPGGPAMSVRSQSLAQPADLFATLADWLGVAPQEMPAGARSLWPLAAGESDRLRDCAFSENANEAAVTTPAWFLHLDKGGKAQLFAKPDDRWESNEVADRCGDIPSRLAHLIDQFRKLLNSDKSASFPELPKDLLEGID